MNTRVDGRSPSPYIINIISMFVCLSVCLSDRLRKTFERSELSTCGFLQMFRNLSNSVTIYFKICDDVIKGVYCDVIMTSSGLYGVKNVIFGH